MSQTKEPVIQPGTIDMLARKRLYEAFQMGEPPPVTTAPSREGPMAKVMETLFNELVQAEKVVLEATKATKPATLKGKFEYVESALNSTEKRLSAFSTEEVQGGKVTKTMVTLKIRSIRTKLSTAQTTQVGLSLKQLTEQAADIGGKTTEFVKQAVVASKLTGDAQKEAKAKLYKEATALQTEAGVAVADWTGHVNEAGKWLVLKAADFNKQIALLTQADNRLGSVIESCLPQLTSRPVGPNDPKPTVVGATVPPITDAATAMKECGNNWVTAKQTYGADKAVMQQLADFRKTTVDKYLNDTLPPLGLEYGPGKGWVSVGSADPTSDYDISINKHGTVDGTPGGKPVYDYVMVKNFNAWFRGKFGAEGGTVFDTNLYASAPPLVHDDNPEAASVNDVAALMKMRRYMSPGEFESFRVETMAACAGNPDQQDKVGHQFAMADNNYRMVVADLIESGADKLTERIDERVKAGLDSLDEDARHQHDEEVKLRDEAAEWVKQGKAAKGIAAYGLIEEAEELSRDIDHHLKDAALHTTNEVYAEKIGQVRNQEQIAKLLSDMNAAVAEASSGGVGQLLEMLKDAAKQLTELKVDSKAIDGLIKALDTGDEPVDPSVVGEKVKSLSSQLGRELGDQMQKLGDLTTIARYFANEAYQSDGPFAHVVTATQGAEAEATNALVAKEIEGTLAEGDKQDEAGKDRDPKTLIAMARAGGVEAFKLLGPPAQKELLDQAQKDIDKDVKALKKERQDALPADQCLQSFNEQLGDFLKDLEHYGDDEPGKAIIQSSKYLERLQDATRLMKDKDMFADAGSFLVDIEKELSMQNDVKGKLIAARKGNLLMVPEAGDTPVDQAEQRRAFACKFMKDLGVKSVGDLAKRYRTFGIKVNAIARKALAKTPLG